MMAPTLALLATALLGGVFAQSGEDRFHGKVFYLKGACSGGKYYMSVDENGLIGSSPEMSLTERFLVTRDFRTPGDYNLQAQSGSKGYVSIDHDHSVHTYHLGGHCQRFKIVKDTRTANEWNMQGDCGKKWFLSIDHGGTVKAYRLGGHCQRFQFIEYTVPTSAPSTLATPYPTSTPKPTVAQKPTDDVCQELTSHMSEKEYAQSCKAMTGSGKEACAAALCKPKGGSGKCKAKKKVQCKKVPKGDVERCCSFKGCSYARGKCRGKAVFD